MSDRSVKPRNAHVHIHAYNRSWKCECGYVLPENLRQDRTLGNTDLFEERMRRMIRER
jgi:hypothetical protein